MHDGAIEQLITNLERAGTPYSLPDDWILCLDDDVLRDVPRGERRKWLRKAKAEALRRNLQERVDEIVEEVEDEDVEFAEVLLSALIEDSKNFPELTESARRRWIKIATAAMQRSGDGPCVYFVGTEDKKLVKIGFTTKIEHRLRSLSTASPQGLIVYLVIPGDAANERELHERFAPYRIRGEWFQLSEPIAKFISEHNLSSES